MERNQRKMKRKNLDGETEVTTTAASIGGPKRSSVPIELQKSKKRSRKESPVVPRDKYSHLEPAVADQMRRDDEEIASLEHRLGLADTKERKRLANEYAKLECYGDDFGVFLDDLDSMVQRITNKKGDEVVASANEEEVDSNTSGEHSETSQELVPMKSPAYESSDEDDSIMKELEAEAASSEQESDDGENSESAEDFERDDSFVPDHDASHTYRPSEGQDVYGKSLDAGASEKKYVPPHQRCTNPAVQGLVADATHTQDNANICRALNNALNRLSDDSLIPVSQAIAQLYGSFAAAYVNECVWQSMQDACLSRSQLMHSLIPSYVACIAGVHIQVGDTAQLGEYLMEKAVLELFFHLAVERQGQATMRDSDEGQSKTSCNLILLVCYLYNFNIIQCTLLYDIVRNLLESFREVDVELLLLILCHCGRALRSDDPVALKDIVTLVQKRAAECGSSLESSSSRVDYMVEAMTDLKNNKRRRQDLVHSERTEKLRKMLGRVKCMAATSSNARVSDSSLRISLRDILDVESKGRWWKIGASWVGNVLAYSENAGETEESASSNRSPHQDPTLVRTKEDERLLKLATKYRINTDTRRTIFCIIMGASDCDDAFEKLVRASMLKNRTERDAARVLLECCGHEKSYNKFYAHLAVRMCAFQPQCRFSLQLAFWDTFKQFQALNIRKAANLANLLFQLVAIHPVLKLNVLKPIEMSSPDDLPESAMIFLTIFLSSLLEHFDDASSLSKLIEAGVSSVTSKRDRRPKRSEWPGEDEGPDDGDSLRSDLLVFFAQVLKSSPKYKRDSKFKINLKAAIKACTNDNVMV